jgi:DNA-binding Lrp family transcriptional regulator
MVTAIVLLNVERGRINGVAEDLAGRQGVSEVYSVSGNYDLVALLRVQSNEEMARLVTEELATVDGIEHTETMLAFRAHSRHDLEAMFSVGA